MRVIGARAVQIAAARRDPEMSKMGTAGQNF